MNFVDLFSGCGGLTKGFIDEGFEQIFAVDFDKDACDTYRKNFPKHKVLQKDIRELTKSDINKLINRRKVDIVIGGPPCQGFSMAGKIGRNFIDDPRNDLFKEFIRVASIIKPKYIVMENVARLNIHNKGKTKEDIIKSFRKIGYLVDSKIICTVDYNVPQVRNRVLFIGNRLDKANCFPIPTKKKHKTIKDAIDDLPKLQSGNKSNIANHVAMNHSKDMLLKMSYIKDGGNRKQIPEKLRPKTGDSRKYIRYDSSKPAVCVTGDMRKIFHYNQNRALTVRELARLQSFNDDFIFLGRAISQQQQVGNAVPPLLARSIAQSIKIMDSNFKN